MIRLTTPFYLLLSSLTPFLLAKPGDRLWGIEAGTRVQS
jgi:hypothetical protein